MHRRERRRVISIHKNEPGTGQMGEYVFFQGGFGGGIVCRFKGGLEQQLGERRKVGETPVFVLQRREAQLCASTNWASRRCSLVRGARLVKRQSSSCNVGKPSSLKRTRPALRSGSSHDSSDADSKWLNFSRNGPVTGLGGFCVMI